MDDQYTLDTSDEMIRLQQAWENVMRRVGPEVPPAWFERFLRPLTPMSLTGEVVVLNAPGKFILEWVKERYFRTLQSCLGDELGQAVTLELRSEAREKAPQQPAIAGQAITVTAVEDAKFRPFERYAFDTFVVGQSNRLAVAGAKAVASDPGTKYNPLFIYGASGLGKTHLLHSIARELQATNPKYPLVYISAQQFAEEFVAALQAGRMEQFRRHQRNVETWLLDDVQFIAGKDKTQEELFHTFNYLHSIGKQIVLSSDRPPRDLYLMDERLRSRFESGLVADMQMPDTETRCAILQSKASFDRIDLTYEVAMFLAENVPGNIRVLEGALTKLTVHASVEGMAVDLPLAQEMVEQYYRTGALAKPSVDTIVSAVSRHYKVPPAEIKGVSRKAPIVHARHIAVYITREITRDSWKHIGSMFGDRDHSSMMHGYQKVSEMMQQDKDLRAAVKTLIRGLYPET